MTRPTVVSMYCFTNSIGSVCIRFWLSNALHQIDDFAGVAQLDRRERFDFAHFERDQNVVDRGERAAFALGAGTRFGQVVRPSTMSCVGTAMGAPCAGDRILFDDSISVDASICASGDSGMWTAI